MFVETEPFKVILPGLVVFAVIWPSSIWRFPLKNALYLYVSNFPVVIVKLFNISIAVLFTLFGSVLRPVLAMVTVLYTPGDQALVFEITKL